MIYLASPYTHERVYIRQRRYLQAHRYTQRCMDAGEVIFSPIVYGHEFGQRDAAAVPFEYWQDFNRHMIRASGELRVLTLSGWKSSRGVLAEMRYAEELGLPINLVELPDEDI